MSNVFTGRSLTVIDDFSIEERGYLFDKTRRLKDAMIAQDERVLEEFRIDDSAMRRSSTGRK
jgi:aspartate carbamoyltransferase